MIELARSIDRWPDGWMNIQILARVLPPLPPVVVALSLLVGAIYLNCVHSVGVVRAARISGLCRERRGVAGAVQSIAYKLGLACVALPIGCGWLGK